MIVFIVILVGIILLISILSDSIEGKIGLFLAGASILMLIGGLALNSLWEISRILFIALILYLVVMLFINIFR